MKGFIFLFLGGLAILAFLTPSDFVWTLKLHEQYLNLWPHFASFMKRSFFEGEWPGGSDVGILFGVAVLAAYFRAIRKQALSSRWRPAIGYLTFVVLTTPVIIHSLKLIANRPRPHFYPPFFPWYDVTSFFWSFEVAKSSFPSGHVASAVIPLSLAYVLFRHLPSWKSRLAVVLFSVAILLHTGFMGIARAMTWDHWLTDSFSAAMIVILHLHASYYWILKVEEQEQMSSFLAKVQQFKRFWELKLVAFCLISSLALVTGTLILRGFWDVPPFLREGGFLVFLLIFGFGLWCFARERAVFFKKCYEQE